MHLHNHVFHPDVVVFGAGPAGIAAAVAAGREGLDVYLIEVQNKIGGIMSACPGMMLGAGYPTKKTIGGFFDEFVEEMYAANPPMAEKRECSLEEFGEEVVYNHEYAISVLYKMLKDAGVKLLVNSIPYEVLVEDDTITGVEVVNTAGCDLFIAKQYIDCTGNGDIATKAGVPSQLGNEQGLMMGASLTFFMENVDWDVAFANSLDPYFTKFAEKGIAQGRIHKTIPQIYMLKGLREGTVFFNTVTITGVDGTKTESVLNGTIVARERAMALAQFCTEEIPGFAHAYPTYVGPLVGIRETRKLEGMYCLTYNDVAMATKFKDGIVACDNPLDEVFRDESTTHYSHNSALEKGQYYTISFSCLVPKQVKNLLFAGRNMSVDITAFASVRGMPQCMLMGQSVGVGASIAIKNNCAVQSIPSDQLIKQLTSSNVKGIGANPL